MVFQPSSCLWVALLSFVVTIGLLGDAASQEKVAAQIDALVRDLGDATFKKREKAGQELIGIGEKALPALRKVLASSEDLEIRIRAEKLIKTIILGVRKSKSIDLEMVLVESGTFQMGSPPSEPTRNPNELLHKVLITRPFLLGKYEVTQEEYQRVMKTTPSLFARTGGSRDKVAGQDTKRFPVENVTWYDAIEFCNTLSKQDGYEPYYQMTNITREGNSIKSADVAILESNGYRLPTEAEWEYACRAGTNTQFHFGFKNNGSQANLKALLSIGIYGGPSTWKEVGRTTKVGSYAANLWGLHDMHGNVAEWCWDWYDKDYYARSPENDPPGPNKGIHRIIRGGSWLLSEGSCRSANRFWLIPGDRNYYTGFRVARTP